MTWRIYYGDGSTADGVDPFSVSGLDVQAIKQADPEVGWYVLHGENFYWWVVEDVQWHQGDSFGLWDYLQRPGPKKVIFGRSHDNASYQRLKERVLNDEDGFGAKSALLAEERAL